MSFAGTSHWIEPVRTADLPILHFVHGNSFPTGTYRVFLDFLRENYLVQALEMHGHNPAYPVNDCWVGLCQELIATLSERYSEPVILAGHSLGGMLCLMAARLRPDLVRCVVMLDSPVVAGWRAKVLFAAKIVGLDKRLSPASSSERRRTRWESAEAAYQHFLGKRVFARWPDQVLRDYVRYGTEPHQAGVALRFNREIETAIYRTLPHGVSKLLHKPFPVPVGFIGGLDSVECRQAGLLATKRLVGEHFIQIPGGHLYPWESPEQAAVSVHAMIGSLLKE